MLHKFPVGSSEECDQLVLPEGALIIASSMDTLRIHNGSAQGGGRLGIMRWEEVLPVENIRYTTSYLNSVFVYDWNYVDSL